MGGLGKIPCTGRILCSMRIKACTAKVSVHKHVCMCANMNMHLFITRSALWSGKKAPVLANKHFCIVDSSAMILLVNLSAFDSKPLEAIISNK